MGCIYALIDLLEVCLPHTLNIITKNKLKTTVYKLSSRHKEVRLSVVNNPYLHYLTIKFLLTY